MKFDPHLAQRAADIAAQSLAAVHGFGKRHARKAAAVAAAVMTGSAFADSTAAVTAITGAQTDATTIVGAITAMGIAIWAGLFVYRKFFK